METINAAIKELVENVAREEWSTVWVAVAPSTVSLTFQDGREPLECRVRFLSFLGIGQNVQQAAFIMHTAQVLVTAAVLGMQCRGKVNHVKICVPQGAGGAMQTLFARLSAVPKNYFIRSFLSSLHIISREL